MGRNATSAWTLIELLVVIAIIAVLAGLLVPVVTKDKDKARLVQCRNHMRQLGIALRLYAGDNEGRLPVFPRSEPANGRGAVVNLPMRSIIQPYVAGSEGVFICPKDPGRNASGDYVSYVWKFSWNGKLLDKARNGAGPLMTDREPWHPRSGKKAGRNGVFQDGRVDWSE